MSEPQATDEGAESVADMLPPDPVLAVADDTPGELAARIGDSDFVTIVTAQDGECLAMAGQYMRALSEMDIPFHIRIVSSQARAVDALRSADAGVAVVLGMSVPSDLPAAPSVTLTDEPVSTPEDHDSTTDQSGVESDAETDSEADADSESDDEPDMAAFMDGGPSNGDVDRYISAVQVGGEDHGVVTDTYRTHIALAEYGAPDPTAVWFLAAIAASPVHTESLADRIQSDEVVAEIREDVEEPLHLDPGGLATPTLSGKDIRYSTIVHGSFSGSIEGGEQIQRESGLPPRRPSEKQATRFQEVVSEAVSETPETVTDGLPDPVQSRFCDAVRFDSGERLTLSSVDGIGELFHVAAVSQPSLVLLFCADRIDHDRLRDHWEDVTPRIHRALSQSESVTRSGVPVFETDLTDGLRTVARLAVWYLTESEVAVVQGEHRFCVVGPESVAGEVRSELASDRIETGGRGRFAVVNPTSDDDEMAALVGTVTDAVSDAVSDE